MSKNVENLNKRPKIFFIVDKWGGGKKEYGLAEWEGGMQRSLESTGLADFTAFHLDDHFITTGQKGDAALLQKLVEYKPDLVYLITYAMPGKRFSAPEFYTLDKIKNEFKIPIVALFGDLAVRVQVKISLAVLPYVDLIVAPELTAALSRIGKPDKYILLWTPKDPRIFNNPNKNRDIDVGYVGSSRKDRHKIIMYLLNNGVNMVFGGRANGEPLVTEEFANRYQRSKIALSFARVKSSHAILARLFEAMTCGAMVLEQESFEAMKLYTPYVDYVPYSGKKDLLKKVRYYLKHDEERQKIALNGQKKTEELYSARRFWQIVIDRALKTDPAQTYYLDYEIPAENLAHLSAFTARKMKFLNSLCSTSVGFVIFKIFNWRYWQEANREFWHHAFFVPIGKIKPFLEKKMPKKVFEFVLKLKRKLIKTH